MCLPRPPSSETLKKKKNITMAMISAFTTIDKTAHNSSSFRHVQGTTSRDLWLSFEKVYAPHSTSREYTLKTQLLRIKMHDDKTHDACLNRAQDYVDAPAAIGEPVKDKDLVMLVVSGLREEYNGLKTTITARQSPTAFSELHALLKIAAQLSALGFQVSPIAPSGLQAFYGARPSNNNSSNNNTNRGNHNNSRGNNNNRGHGNGRQFDWASTQNTVYDTCNRCGIGHIPSQCPNRDPFTIRTRPSPNFANTRGQSSNASANWHSDTRANSHVTPDLEVIDNSEAYYSDDALHVGNAQKSDVYSTFKSFVQMVERQFTTKLKNVQTDYGGGFRNLASFFSSLGIIHRRSCPHTSEQNGFVERRNRHVVETGLTLLAQACVPQRFWDYAFDTAIHLLNIYSNGLPTTLFFVSLGAYVFPIFVRPIVTKWISIPLRVSFLATASHHGYHCLDISTEGIYIARHVRFNKTQFPFDIPNTTSPPPLKTSPYYSSESPYIIPTSDHPSPSSPRSPISSPSLVSHLSPTSQTSPESSNGQPSLVSTTSILTPPPPITRQRLANLR
ncbi:nucleotide-binding alpha-beta plait domain-containing protein [Tanacetum coccineum]